jgi:hypothetical protein
MRLTDGKCRPFFIIRKKSKNDAHYQLTNYLGNTLIHLKLFLSEWMLAPKG